MLALPTRIDPDTEITPLTFSPALLQQALDVGVQPTFFISIGKAEATAPVADQINPPLESLGAE